MAAAKDPQKQIASALQRLQAGGGKVSGQQAGYADPTRLVKEQIKSRITNPATDIGKTALSILSRGSQLAPRYVDSLRTSGEGSGARGATSDLEVLRDYFGAQPRAIASALGGVADLQGQDDVALSKAMTGKEATSGKGRALDFGASVVLDPTTYLGVGLVGAAGKAGKGAIAAEHGAKAASQVGKGGVQGLNAAQKAAVGKTLTDYAAANADNLKGDGGLTSLLRGAVGKGARTGEERFLQNASKQLAKGEGIQFAGKTVLPFEKIKAAAGAAGLSKATQAALQAPGAGKGISAANTLKNLVQPRAAVAANLGQGAADTLRSAQAQGSAYVEQMNLGDLNRLRASLGTNKAGLANSISDKANGIIDEAIRTNRVEAGVKHFLKKGDKTAASYLRALDDVQKDVAKRTANEAATLGARAVTAPPPVVPEIPKPVAPVAEQGDLLGMGGKIADPSSAGARLAAKMNPLPLPEPQALPPVPEPGSLGTRGPEQFQVGAQDALFGAQVARPVEEGVDIGKAVLQDAAEVNKGLGKQRTAQVLLNGVDDSGKPLALLEPREGYKAINAGPKGTIYVRAEISDEIGNFYKVLDNDEGLQAMSKGLQAGQRAWRNLALNSLPFGGATAVRNGVSDVMMMVVRGGFTNSNNAYGSAAKVEKAIQKASKSGLPITAALKDPSLSRFERNGLKVFLREGLIEGGIQRSDVGTEGIAATKAAQAKAAANISRPDSAFTKTFAGVNTRISDVNRLALAYDHMAKSGNPMQAVYHAKDSLIDYSDLTKQERWVKNYIAPFYTFAARNLANNIRSSIRRPGKVKNVEALREYIFGQGEQDTGVVPDYVLGRGQNSTMTINGTPIFANIESPFQSAASIVQPLGDLASTLNGNPTEGGVKGAAGGALQNVGGVLGTAAKQAGSEAAGTDLFTGAPLDPQESWLKRTAEGQIPIVGRSETGIRDLSSDDPAVQRARILNLLGITATANTEKAQSSEQYRRIRELGESAKRQGTPTLTELREQGRAPKAKSSSGAKSQKKSQKQKKS